jgi:hypothetical protein
MPQVVAQLLRGFLDISALLKKVTLSYHISMDIFKLIIGLPKWLLLLPLRLTIALLNLIPCRWAQVCKKESYLIYVDEYQQSVPTEPYLVASTKCLRFGHFLVALIRGHLHEEKIFKIEVQCGLDGFPRHHKIISRIQKKVLYEDILDTIREESKLLS